MHIQTTMTGNVSALTLRRFYPKPAPTLHIPDFIAFFSMLSRIGDQALRLATGCCYKIPTLHGCAATIMKMLRQNRQEGMTVT
jgi:hypothetical protein